MNDDNLDFVSERLDNKDLFKLRKLNREIIKFWGHQKGQINMQFKYILSGTNENGKKIESELDSEFSSLLEMLRNTGLKDISPIDLMLWNDETLDWDIITIIDELEITTTVNISGYNEALKTVLNHPNHKIYQMTISADESYNNKILTTYESCTNSKFERENKETFGFITALISE